VPSFPVSSSLIQLCCALIPGPNILSLSTCTRFSIPNFVAWFAIRCTSFHVTGSLYKIPYAWSCTLFPLPGFPGLVVYTLFPMPSSRSLVSCAWFHAPGSRCIVPCACLLCLFPYAWFSMPGSPLVSSA
jgi:hypothetical protein